MEQTGTIPRGLIDVSEWGGLFERPGPVATVCVGTPSANADASHRSRLRGGEARRRLEAQGTPSPVADTIEDLIADAHQLGEGLAVYADISGFLRVAHSPVAPRHEVVRWDSPRCRPTLGGAPDGALPRPVAERTEQVTGTRAADGGGDRSAREIARMVETVAARQTVAVLEEFRLHMGRGDRAVEGVGPTMEALREARVAALLFHDDPDDDRRAWFSAEPAGVAATRAQLEGVGSGPLDDGRLMDTTQILDVVGRREAVAKWSLERGRTAWQPRSRLSGRPCPPDG